MKILNISLIPEKNCNNNESHFNESDPIKLWIWDGGEYYHRSSPLYDITDTYLNDPQNDDISVDELNYNDYQYIDITANSTEITIVTKESKEIFSLDEITYDNNDCTRTELKIKHFGKEVYENYNIKEISSFKELLKSSIDFTKEIMRELIYNDQENLDDEYLIKQTLEIYFKCLDDIISSKRYEIQNRLDEFDL